MIKFDEVRVGGSTYTCCLSLPSGGTIFSTMR